MTWQTVALSEAATITRVGVMPADITFDTTYVGLENINGRGDFVGIDRTAPVQLASTKFKFTKEEILFGKLRPYLKKTARPHFDGICSTDILPLLPMRHVDRDYLFHVLRRQSFVDEVTSLCAGANLPRISPKVLGAMRIPLPPLYEQRRIAAILDKADGLRVKRCEAIDKLGEFLLAAFVAMFGDPVRNTNNLPLVSLGELGEWRSGGTPSRSNPSFFQGSLPWYSSGELNSPYLTNSKECISTSAVSSSAVRIMASGSLMIGMYDTAAFKSSITTIPAACNQAIAFSLLDPKQCETTYVYQALQVGKEHFKRLQRGVRQKNLNLSMIRETRIPLPPLRQQREFAKIFASVIEQTTYQNKQLEEMDNLFFALQRDAFAGTL